MPSRAHYTAIRNASPASSHNSMELEMTNLQDDTAATENYSNGAHVSHVSGSHVGRRPPIFKCSRKTIILLLVLIPIGLAALVFVILLGAGIVTPRSLGLVEPADPQYELVQCKEGWTRCDNGYECIPDYWWCDGREEHCSDNSDERGCEGGCQLSEYHYYYCKNGDCIKKQWRCDREKDCVGGDDEQDCEKCNPQTEFTCYNYDCVPLHNRCDGVFNCRDTSDEYNCFKQDSNRLKYLYNSSWVDICYSDFSVQSAGRICALLGHRSEGAESSSISRDSASSIAAVITPFTSNQTTNGTFIVTEQSVCSQAVNLKCSACGQSTKQIWSPYLLGGTGGFPASDWPWHVKLTIGNHICGGSIISENWILTAAHCLTNYTSRPSDVKIVYGTTRFSGAGGVTRIGREIVTHPQFLSTKYQLHFTTFSYDMTLVRVDPISYNDNVQPVCLPTQDDILSNITNCYITGFGSIVQSISEPKYPVTLREGKTRIFSKQDCTRYYHQTYNLPVPDIWLCAGYLTSGIDSCGGDSGGPLVCQMNGRWVLQGLVSWGSFCKQSVPSIYTRVSLATDWINEYL